jgi:hypothetical protein
LREEQLPGGIFFVDVEIVVPDGVVVPEGRSRSLRSA